MSSTSGCEQRLLSRCPSLSAGRSFSDDDGQLSALFASHVAGYPTDKPPGHVREEARLLACIMHHQVASNSTALTAEDLRKEEKEAKSICHRSRWTAVVTGDNLGTFGPCFLPGRVVGVPSLVSYSRSGWSVPSCLFLWTKHRDEERR
jgi:hypothetical protein